MLTIKEILTSTKTLPSQKSLTVRGWVQSVRQNKFVEIKDGSSLKALQLIGSPSLISQLKAVKTGSYLQAKGQLILTPHREQSCELKLSKIISVSLPEENYPFQKKKIPLEIVRNYPHLRAKTNYFLALFRLRHRISKALHDFFDQAGFYYVPTPIITSNDTEGAGETFDLTTNSQESFFSKPAQLTVSGQLHAEALAQGLGKVYTFSPCFRAEKSHATRHLAEFWMVEVELAPTDLETLLKLVESLVKFVINSVLTNCSEELKYFERYHSKEIISRLTALTKADFLHLDYHRALQILQLKESSGKIFTFDSVEWGMDLKAEHEKYLCHWSDDRPLFIINYPKDLKPFYMKNNGDDKTVAGFDLIFPSVGELVGGSLREVDYKTLQTKAQKVGINPSELTWYFDLRRSGYAPSGGFGLGLERLIMFISGTENIRDTIAFPCFHKYLEF